MSYHGIDKLRLDGATVEENMGKLNAWLDILAEKLNYNFTHIDMPDTSELEDNVAGIAGKVDELADKAAEIDSIADELQDVFRLKNYQYSRSIAANTTVSITGTQLGVSTPAGYTPLAITRLNIGTAGVVLVGLHPNAIGSSSVIEVRNVTGSAITQNINLFILYVKSSFMA